MPVDRYHRQTLLPFVGTEGQAKLAAASVMIVGVGALGTVSADYLARAGVGRITLVDRDVVEWTNLQRQTLFDESHARAAVPKAVAAAERLAKVNSEITLTPVVADLDVGTASNLLADVQPTVIVDGTDNAETRYLINDLAVKRRVPWIYGAAVSTTGRVMPIVPSHGPCLRCVFENPPAAGELPTCDTAGVFAPAAGVVGSLQAALALQVILSNAVPLTLTSFDLTTGRFHATDLADACRADCPCCGQRQFDFADAVARSTARLCGRGAVQVRTSPVAFDVIADRLSAVGAVSRSSHAVAFKADSGEALTVFADGRVLVHHTDDPAKARSIVARFLGG